MGVAWRSCCGAGGWAALGLWRADWPVAPPSKPLSVVLVQGDVAEGEKWSQDFALDIFRQYMRLTEEGVEKAGPGPKVVIWPETAVPWLLEPVRRCGRPSCKPQAGHRPWSGRLISRREHRPQINLWRW